jgi:hypothetical protein
VSTDPGRRRGRRDNGLDAPAYVPLADVDPRVGEHLLDVLWAAGVPAYLEPSADVEPTRALTMPSPPTDRLWVDRERRLDARSIVETEMPRGAGGPPPDAAGMGVVGSDVSGPDTMPTGHYRLDAAEKQAWRDLVAEFGRTHPADLHPWPDAEKLGPAPGARRGEAPGDEPRVAPDTIAPDKSASDDTASNNDPSAADDTDDEHYVPPPPPPVPRPSKQAVFALLVLAFGTLLLVAPGVVGLGGDVAFVFGVLAVVGAVGLLVWRLKEDRSTDGPDDGAVV